MFAGARKWSKRPSTPVSTTIASEIVEVVAIGVRSWNAEWNDTSDAIMRPVNTWMSSQTAIEPNRVSAEPSADEVRRD